jgi:hypothetical protein
LNETVVNGIGSRCDGYGVWFGRRVRSRVLNKLVEMLEPEVAGVESSEKQRKPEQQGSVRGGRAQVAQGAHALQLQGRPKRRVEIMSYRGAARGVGDAAVRVRSWDIVVARWRVGNRVSAERSALKRAAPTER